MDSARLLVTLHSGIVQNAHLWWSLGQDLFYVGSTFQCLAISHDICLVIADGFLKKTFWIEGILFQWRLHCVPANVICSVPLPKAGSGSGGNSGMGYVCWPELKIFYIRAVFENYANTLSTCPGSLHMISFLGIKSTLIFFSFWYEPRIFFQGSILGGIYLYLR